MFCLKLTQIWMLCFLLMFKLPRMSLKTRKKKKKVARVKRKTPKNLKKRRRKMEALGRSKQLRRKIEPCSQLFQEKKILPKSGQTSSPTNQLSSRSYTN